MYRAARILLIAGIFLTAACGTSRTSAAGAAGTVPAPAPAGTAQGGAAQGGAAQGGAAQGGAASGGIRSTCEAVGQVYDKNMSAFAEALTKMVGDGAAGSRQRAQQALKTFAIAVRTATQASTEPQLRADGKQTADRLQTKAADAGFFSKIRTTEDLNTVLGPTLQEWLSPVTHHCS
jgi:hypothetical protein